MTGEYGRDGATPTEKVHVRQLGVGDTLRWSWDVVRNHRELVGLAFVVGLLSIVPLFGVTPASTPSDDPSVAPWVGPFYLAYALTVGVLFGSFFLTADDAVSERPRPLKARLSAALRRIPALVLAGLVAVGLSIVGLVVLVLPGIYLFHRFLPTFPAIVIDGKGPFAGLSAGWNASGGNVTKLFFVTVGYVGACLVLVLVWYSLGLVGPLLSAGLAAGLLPLFGLALGHLYLEQDRNQ
ncbi:hypothetical protein [Halorussus halophilus]|uniref:hypothetical protein n=1 Tax=Halorussus halophilus TaxID=2650975 RepID=UPI001300CC18|nr:hypothetical protein [Halorussus halophilus]